MTRGKALLLSLGVFGLGAIGYFGFTAAGYEGFSAGIAAEAVLIVLVLGWTASYLLRVVSGDMTYMEQRRRYRATYDAATDDALQRSFDALPPEEQARLLKEVGQLQADADL
jgi:hypothetical protein